MKKLNFGTAAVCIALAMVGCSNGVSKESDGSVRVSHGLDSCRVYVVEKDGYKFAVAVSAYSCAITQIKE
jgi:hypothetical protein